MLPALLTGIVRNNGHDIFDPGLRKRLLQDTNVDARKGAQRWASSAGTGGIGFVPKEVAVEDPPLR